MARYVIVNSGPRRFGGFQVVLARHRLDVQVSSCILKSPVWVLQVLVWRVCRSPTWTSGWPMQLSSDPSLHMWQASFSGLLAYAVEPSCFGTAHSYVDG